tara:strand:- start:748 stop:1053 length:306 start_codon:yes stop_codon:yes gene_type:complete
MNNDITDGEFLKNVRIYNNLSHEQRMKLLVKRTQDDMMDQVGVSPLVAAAHAVGRLFKKKKLNPNPGSTRGPQKRHLMRYFMDQFHNLIARVAIIRNYIKN